MRCINMRKIPESILEKIGEAKAKQLKELDLSTQSFGPDEKRLSFIPPEVFELTQLEVLNLSGNKIAAIPEVIGQLRKLTTLDLTYNELTVVPDAIGQLQSLTELKL